MRNTLHKTVDVICIVLDLAFSVLVLPFKFIKAALDIIAVFKRKTA